MSNLIDRNNKRPNRFIDPFKDNSIENLRSNIMNSSDDYNEELSKSIRTRCEHSSIKTTIQKTINCSMIEREDHFKVILFIFFQIHK
jgi:hypothetical protein